MAVNWNVTVRTVTNLCGSGKIPGAFKKGKYPVIFLTFKDVKFDSWQATIDKMKALVQQEYARHMELLESHAFQILYGTESIVELSSSLEYLSKMLATHYHQSVMIIIDEYDTPIQEGYSKDFYDDVIGFMRNFFSGAFKDNKNLAFGF